MHYRLTDIQADFEITQLNVRYQITAKRNYFHRLQTDGQTDGRADVAYDDNRKFFRKRINLLEMDSNINLKVIIKHNI